MWENLYNIWNKNEKYNIINIIVFYYSVPEQKNYYCTENFFQCYFL